MVAHVGDFGIAKILVEKKSRTQTKTLGTLGYIAPGKHLALRNIIFPRLLSEILYHIDHIRIHKNLIIYA